MGYGRTLEELYSRIAELEAERDLLREKIDEVLEIQNRNYGNGIDLHLDMIDFARETKAILRREGSDGRPKTMPILR